MNTPTYSKCIHLPKKIQNMKTTTIFKDLMKIWLNFDHSKVPNYTLAMIFEGIFSHKDVTPYVESL